MYYLPIDQLISKCGRQFIIDMLPSLFIEINTYSAKDKTALFDYTYLGKSLNKIPDLETYIKQGVTSKQEHVKEHLEDIQTIIDIFSECKDKSNIDIYDYVVFSYLGDFTVKYENQVSDYKNPDKSLYFGKSLYLDIQAVRIALIDEIIRRQWTGYYNIFNTGIKYIGGLILFKFSYSYLGSYFYAMKKMIGM
jgi:hypothetical protein